MQPPPHDDRLRLAVDLGLIPEEAAAKLSLRLDRMRSHGVTLDPIQMAVREGWLSEAAACKLVNPGDDAAVEFPTEQPCGEAGTLGEFDLLGRIDGHPERRAGAGAVFLAQQDGQSRAIKVFPANFDARAKDDGASQVLPAFLSASRKLASLDGPGTPLIGLFSAGCSSGLPFLAMEHVAGRDLATEFQRAAGRGLGLPAILEIARSGLEVIDLLSRHGLAHGTLGQGSFILDKQNTCRVLPPCPLSLAVDTSMIATSGVPTAISRLHDRRSPDYRAPEMAQARQPADQGSDLYSLGLVLYQACVGALPFPGVGPSPEPTHSGAATAQVLQRTHRACAIASLRQRVQREVPSLATVTASLPSALESVVWKLTRRDPEKRYATAAEALEDLRGANPRPLDEHPGAINTENDTVRIRRPDGLSRGAGS